MKKLTKTGLLSFAVTGVIAAATLNATAFSAKADEKIFDTGYLANRTYIDGITQADVENAFETEGARLKAAVEAAGEGSVFEICNPPLGNGWPENGPGTYFVAAHMNLGEYSGWNNWGKTGYAFIVYNPHDNAAYTIRGNAAVAYTNMNNGWTDQVIHAGYPKGNDFTVEETTYQNFTLGYSAGSEFIYGKNVDGEGVEFDLTAEDVANNMVIPVYNDTVSAEIIKGLSIENFVSAYKAYYTDKELNFNPMYNYNNLKNSQWRQKTSDGGEVVYNSVRNEMFTVKTFLAGYNGTTEWGNPIGEETETRGVVNQQFANGVAVVEDGEVKFYAASHVDEETGEIVSDFNEDAVGRILDDTIAKLPSGITAEAISAAAKAVWTAELGNPVGYMEFVSDTVLEQTFSNTVTVADKPVTLTSRISIDTARTPVEAALLDSETYEIYKLPVRFNEGLKKYDVTGEMLLGPAISSKFTVGEKVYQNFQYGAMELSAADEEDKVLPGVNYGKDGTRTVLDLSEFITVDPATIRIPDSYDVGAADLLTLFREAYQDYIEQGIALGMPNKEGIGAWAATEGGQEDGTNEFKEGRGMIKLGLHATDSTAICYYGVTAYLAYNPEDGKVYIMSDAVVSNMGTYYSAYGAPRGNLTETTIVTEDGDEVTVQVQNFQLGYLTVMGESASMIEDKNWNFELLGEVNLDGSKIPGVEYPGETPVDTPEDSTGASSNGGDSSESGKSGGCGSVVAISAAGISAAAAAFVLFFKKRGNDE